MELKSKNAVENYQCPGCMNGHDVTCFESSDLGGVGCGKHHPATFVSNIGKIILGLPIGFCRVGLHEKLKPLIYDTFESSEWEYNNFNVPVWKHLDKNGNTIVRGLSPRTNMTFIHIFLHNCIDKINCVEITQSDVDEMD